MELNDKRVLVLEDEFLIGLELERIAQECGARSIDLVPTLDELMASLLSKRVWDIAILEVQARGLSSLPAASILRARGIHLVFTTAYDTDSGGIPGFEDVPVVGKPYGKSQIVRAVASLDDTSLKR
jgi:DNA-binding response OmpR family regulator